MAIDYRDNSGRIASDLGYWEVEKYDCGSDCDTERYLHFQLDDPQNGYFDYNTWELTFIGSGKIKAREVLADGTYKYKLGQLY